MPYIRYYKYKISFLILFSLILNWNRSDAFSENTISNKTKFNHKTINNRISHLISLNEYTDKMFYNTSSFAVNNHGLIELNTGLGIRWLSNCDNVARSLMLIYGVRSSPDRYRNQSIISYERLGEKLECRTSIYLPISRGIEYNTNYIKNNGYFADAGIYFEVGGALGTSKLKAYIGHGILKVDSIIRLKIEYKIKPWLNIAGEYINSEYCYRDEREISRGFIGIEYSYNFTSKKSQPDISSRWTSLPIYNID
ncbi:MAG: hypothetical protein HRT87_11200 [Legionellales bacterium]|nr:hypothetical protein [Legionellales bacterium]